MPVRSSSVCDDMSSRVAGTAGFSRGVERDAVAHETALQRRGDAGEVTLQFSPKIPVARAPFATKVAGSTQAMLRFGPLPQSFHAAR